MIPALVHANAGARPATAAAPNAIGPAAVSAALRALLRLAPDFSALQPLGTVNLSDGRILQLVITR